MKHTNSSIKYFKNLEEVISNIISMILAITFTLVVFGIPVIVVIIFLKIVSTII